MTDASDQNPAQNEKALSSLRLTPLPGSERAPAPSLAADTEPLDPSARVDATLVLRRRAELTDEALSGGLTAAELAEQHGADPSDVEAVRATLTPLGVQIVETDPGSRRVRIAGPAGLLSRVFGTDLQLAVSDTATGQVTHRHRTGGLSVPAELDGIVTAVLGLDDRPQSRAQFRLTPAAAGNVSYSPLDLGNVYRFPAGTDGSGQTIAIIELGGGFDQADLDTYFTGLGLSQSPKVTAVGVDGAANQPLKDPNGADGEVLLDIDVVGALAPGANILVYFAPNTDAGFVDAVSTAAHAQPAPIAISISWGQSEDQWTPQARAAFDQALADACALGATVTVAAGDDGSSDRQTDGKAHVDFPAASPHALACGGTRLVAATSGAVTSETVWNDGAGGGATGGGISDTFAAPTWQTNVGVPSRAGHGHSSGHGHSKSGASGRGVPDVAAVADPQTGYRVRVDGTDMVIGGTSAVAPLWAALIARIGQSTGHRFGLIQPLLYRGAAAGVTAGGFRDITNGNNGAYSAGPGWDACTGLGVPDGTQLTQLLK